MSRMLAGKTAFVTGGTGGIGVFAGLALLLSGIYQGRCCAASINASKNKPEIFGLSIAPAGIVEGFAVFAFVFALVLSGALPEVQAAEPSATVNLEQVVSSMMNG